MNFALTLRLSVLTAPAKPLSLFVNVPMVAMIVSPFAFGLA